MFNLKMQEVISAQHQPLKRLHLTTAGSSSYPRPHHKHHAREWTQPSRVWNQEILQQSPALLMENQPLNWSGGSDRQVAPSGEVSTNKMGSSPFTALRKVTVETISAQHQIHMAQILFLQLLTSYLQQDHQGSVSSQPAIGEESSELALTSVALELELLSLSWNGPEKTVNLLLPMSRIWATEC
jgi:hypothetical protein